MKYKIIRQIHTWLALPLALLFIAIGLTGSTIAWMHEIDIFLNPGLLRIEIDKNKPQYPLTTTQVANLLDYLNGLPDYAHPSMLELPEKPYDVLIAWYQNRSPNRRQVMINPYTGAIVGERNWGESGFSRALFMPTLFNFHKQLLAGETGKLLISINGIFLATIALSGIYLWWPAMRAKAWWKAITVGRGGSWKRFNFSLHRAAGFYCAPIFLILAITGIYFNKPHWIMPMAKSQITSTAMPAQKLDAPLSLNKALDIAQNNFPLARITRIILPGATKRTVEIRLHQPGELRDTIGATRVTMNMDDGVVTNIQDPLQARSWDLAFSYFFPLHSGELFGLVGKVFISLFGLMPLLFAISGTLIWLRRRTSQKL